LLAIARSEIKAWTKNYAICKEMLQRSTVLVTIFNKAHSKILQISIPVDLSAKYHAPS